MSTHVADLSDRDRPAATPVSLAPLVDAGLIGTAEVHVATRIAAVCDCADDEHLLVAAALAVRAPRLQSVCADLAAPPRATADDGGAFRSSSGHRRTSGWRRSRRAPRWRAARTPRPTGRCG